MKLFRIFFKFSRNTLVILVSTAFGLLGATVANGDEWCHLGTIYGSPEISLSHTDMYPYPPDCAPNLVDVSLQARCVAEEYCESEYSVPPPASNDPNAGSAMLESTIGSYSMHEGITFTCMRCEVPFPLDPIVAEPQGMTWVKRHTDDVAGVVTVGCGTGAGKCDPEFGDQVCSTELPVLCFRPDSSLTKPNSVTVQDDYQRWANGVVGTTPPIAPLPTGLSANILSTLSAANDYCEAEFGTGWRVAEFHEGWGWNFKSYGNVGEHVGRFWVNIDDQPNGNCWSQQ